MMNNDSTEQKSEVDANEIIKPDVSAGLLIQAHLMISDPESGEVLLKIKG